MMGWALKINNMKSNPADWNWSADWQTNIASGAMPADNTLYTARWSVAWVFPFTCLFLYLLAKKINGKSTAVIAVLLMTTNALVLIHTRRAMSESVLLCTTTALIWLIIDFKNRPWLTAILSGLAVNAKQTAIPLMALAGVEIFLLPNTVSLSKKVRNILVFFTIILGISWSLNPAYWRYPTEAIREGLSQRQELTTKMRADYHTSKNPLEQMIFLIAQVFIQPHGSI
jgi:4-amino-4-deoxy-L-arabinose transferase-like glycosyltransferase